MCEAYTKAQKTSISVSEMAQILGIKKTESYWLVKKSCFQTVVAAGRIRVLLPSFEDWYAGQFHYCKVNGPPPGAKWTSSTLSVLEVSDILGVSDSTVYYLLKKNLFSTKQIDNRTRIDRKSFDHWFHLQTGYPKHNTTLP